MSAHLSPVRADDFDWLLTQLPSRRPLKVLDVGCSECPEAEGLLGAGLSVTGVDLDETAIDSTAARVPGAHFLCLDASQPIPGGPWDVALFRRPDLSVQPGRWRSVFATVVAQLTPGGLVLVTNPAEGEARFARQHLEALGLHDVQVVEQPVVDERFRVSAKTRTAKPTAWADDEGGAGEFCDLRTGTCSPTPAHPAPETPHDAQG